MKTCAKCRTPKPLDQFHKNRTQADGYAHYCKPCARTAQNRYAEANRETVNARERQRWQRLRSAVFSHYGDVCACCGASERLSIDHIDGRGKEHVAGLGIQAGTQFYKWLIDNDFPVGFQALCMPCNDSKAEGERCQLDHESGGRHRPGCNCGCQAR